MARPYTCPSIAPVGDSALALTMAVRTSSWLSPIAESFAGSAVTRIAGWSAPATLTSETPETCEMRWIKTVSAAS